ncbi:MAG: hypothetical protein MUF49_30130, partial [Oculatellaceae cyanobacterium Prado106]|nr:hypothetical protein [Oculatellaceae cyanobacterium Prado106]
MPKSLNDRLKPLFLTNLGLAVLILGIAIGIRYPILHRFERLEQYLMQKRLALVSDALIQWAEKLDSSAKAEAIWTEMYDYMAQRNSNFYEETYSYEGMATSPLDVFGLLDRQ